MILHKNFESFNNLINIVSDYYKIDPSHIEKDYYVTVILKELVQKIPGLVFKGGTSLSKCYKLINRFSEDIVLTLEENQQTQSQKKLLKKAILEAITKIDLQLLNLEDIRSRRDYNCYKVEYPKKYNSDSIKPILLIETTYISKSYPIEQRLATSIIYDYLKENGFDEAIKKYELEPFNITVQCLERTLIDKVFAICDYMVTDRLARNSRHIYDISQLLNIVKIDDKLKDLVRKVREEKRENKLCYSSQEGSNVTELLRVIVECDIYKKDYNNVTKAMMFKEVSYEEAIEALKVIIDSELFSVEKSECGVYYG